MEHSNRGDIYHFFESDHRRLDALLEKAFTSSGLVEYETFHQFRVGLLTHIKMEERVLFPAARQANPELMNAVIPRFRLEHGAITALLVLPPTHANLGILRHVVEQHDLAEEEIGGLYDICEKLTKEDRSKILETLKMTEHVPVHPPNPAVIAIESARRALARAGYDFDALLQANE